MRLVRPVRSVIFDLDGVLLDTEILYTEITREIVGRFGKTFDWSLKRHMVGRPAIDSARYLVEALALPIRPEDYLREREAELERRVPSAGAMPGARELTEALRRRGASLAVATSSSRRLFELKTSRHGEWFRDAFAAIVTGDDPRVKAGKPAPDIFLRAAADLGREAAECAVVEDAPAGVAAARAAGMQVVAVPYPGMDREPLAEADLLATSLAELDAETFLGAER